MERHRSACSDAMGAPMATAHIRSRLWLKAVSTGTPSLVVLCSVPSCWRRTASASVGTACWPIYRASSRVRPTISASLSSAAATHPAGNACRRRIWLMRCGLISANRLYWTWPCRVTGIPTAMVCSPRRAVLNRFVTTPCGDRACCRIASGRTLLIGDWDRARCCWPPACRGCPIARNHRHSAIAAHPAAGGGRRPACPAAVPRTSPVSAGRIRCRAARVPVPRPACAPC